MKIWDVVDIRLLEWMKLRKRFFMWILVDKDGVVKKVGKYKDIKDLIVEGDVSFKVKRFENQLIDQLSEGVIMVMKFFFV